MSLSIAAYIIFLEGLFLCVVIAKIFITIKLNLILSNVNQGEAYTKTAQVQSGKRGVNVAMEIN